EVVEELTSALAEEETDLEEAEWKLELLEKLDDYMSLGEIRTALTRLEVEYSPYANRDFLYKLLKQKLMEEYGDK
ncbi:MAG: hypothetical protein ACYSR9_13505, partial [Planctomycetota bacterium]